MSHRLSLPALLCVLPSLLLPPSTASAAQYLELTEPSRWNIVTSMSTYAGPSHADLLFRINDVMQVMTSDPSVRLTDFEDGFPVNVRVHWNYRPALGFSATYGTSSYSSSGVFEPGGWHAPRKLSTRLHELSLALHYGLDFVRSQKLLPYVGFGTSIVMADSRLDIDLLNVSNLPSGDDVPDYPDQHFEVKAVDTTLAYFGLVGLVYRFTNRLSLSAEIQGIMGDLRQDFDYEGSLQYIQPGSSQDDIEDWSMNDILGGVYPLDLVGMRLSIGVMVGL